MRWRVEVVLTDAGKLVRTSANSAIGIEASECLLKPGESAADVLNPFVAVVQKHEGAERLLRDENITLDDAFRGIKTQARQGA